MNSRESIGLVQIIDRRLGKQLLQLSGHTRVVRCLAFNADGTRLVTGSLDKTIVVWDLLSGVEFVFRGHEASIQDVAFSPDGQRVASAGDKLSASGTCGRWNDLARKYSAIPSRSTTAVHSLSFPHQGGIHAMSKPTSTCRAQFDH